MGAVAVGTRAVVRTGDNVQCDGVVVERRSIVDKSRCVFTVGSPLAAADMLPPQRGEGTLAQECIARRDDHGKWTMMDTSLSTWMITGNSLSTDIIGVSGSVDVMPGGAQLDTQHKSR